MDGRCAATSSIDRRWASPKSHCAHQPPPPLERPTRSAASGSGGLPHEATVNQAPALDTEAQRGARIRATYAKTAYVEKGSRGSSPPAAGARAARRRAGAPGRPRRRRAGCTTRGGSRASSEPPQGDEDLQARVRLDLEPTPECLLLCQRPLTRLISDHPRSTPLLQSRLQQHRSRGRL